jgi:hypothetical protein
MILRAGSWGYLVSVPFLSLLLCFLSTRRQRISSVTWSGHHDVLLKFLGPSNHGLNPLKPCTYTNLAFLKLVMLGTKVTNSGSIHASVEELASNHSIIIIYVNTQENRVYGYIIGGWVSVVHGIGVIRPVTI